MIEVDLYIGFEKRNNSTKRPGSSDTAYTINGFLREPCSLENPSINFKEFPSNIHPQAYNYCFIPVFSRYYFIRDWTWNDALWECSMEEDYLASWKFQIGATRAYVMRSASDYNEDIIDRLYPCTTDFTTSKVTMQSSYYGTSPSGGCYVVGIICNSNFSSSQIGGATTYYVLTPSQMSNLMGYLLSSNFSEDIGFSSTWNPLQQLTQDVAKAFINPIQYITSCMWFPEPYSAFTSDDNPRTIVLGYWDCDSNRAQGYRLTSYNYKEIAYSQVPSHPDALTRGRYLNHSPFTRINISVPPFGSLPIDLSYFNSGEYIICDINIDPMTGKAIMRVTKSQTHYLDVNSPVVAEISAMFGIPIQLSQMTPDYLSAFNTFLGMKENYSAGIENQISKSGYYVDNGVFGNIKSQEISGIQDAITSIMPSVSSTGVNGSTLMLTTEPTMTAQFFNIVDEDNIEFGRPLCSVKTINTLSGYVQCSDADVNYPCLANEKSIIINYLHSGFFWE